MAGLARRDLILALAGLAVPAQAQGVPRISVGEGRVRAAVPGAYKTSVFLTVLNPTGEDDVLVGVTCPWAEKATFQRTVWKGLNVSYVVLDEIPVPAHSRVVFKAGYDEIRLNRTTRAFKAGMKVPLELRFKRIGTLTTEIEVFSRLL